MDWGIDDLGGQMSNNLQDALNHTGSTLINFNCILSGLVSQLKASQGNAAVEAAKNVALDLAKVYPSEPGVGPDLKAIAAFFDNHK